VKRERGSTIVRVLELLDEIARSEKPVTATELNDNLHLPKATAHRICAALEEQGYLQRLDGKRFMPGVRLQDLAVGVLSHSRYRAQRHAILMALSQDIGETCNVSYPDGSVMVYADRVETQWPLRLQFPVGTRVPLHCTAAGKLYLSSLPRAKRRSLAATLNLTAETTHSITDPHKLTDALDEVRKSQVGVDNEEFVDGMIALAVPIRDRRGRFYSTVSFHAPVVRMKLTMAKEHIPRLQQAAIELSRLIEVD